MADSAGSSVACMLSDEAAASPSSFAGDATIELAIALRSVRARPRRNRSGVQSARVRARYAPPKRTRRGKTLDTRARAA